MMNSRRICPADGSANKDSAVGLVFMESATGLAMETPKVESAVLAIQEAKKSRKMELERRRSAGSFCQSALRRCARCGISCDDISLHVITISSWLSADEKRSERDEATSWYLEIAIAKRCRLHKLIRQHFALAIKIQQMLFALRSSSRKIPAGSICLIPAGQPDASNSVFPVESLYEPAVAMNTVASFAYPVASSTHPVANFGSRCKKRISNEAWQTDARSSRSDEPAAKQLTTYEEISKLDVNC
ncbi:ABC transporter B family member 15-like [Dorcoceras hygrometricum]|uniref:ABC transporter B family member 15-like n=1 Tax=Dorcoceras hygrometricum TaxID=472368 RepID=A0A2Z7CED9_9LAMI|nr:ABC transporter B family member 15-like [Dorcoceras hygrometricum]